MKLNLKAVLLGLTGIAIVLVMLGGLALSLDERIRAAHQRMDVRTQRLASAGVPLLLNSLVVGDLASAEQTIDNLNVDRVLARRAALRERRTHPHPRRLAAPPERIERSRLGPALHALKVRETRISIAADPVVYAVLAVTPSSAPIEAELWRRSAPR